MIAPLEFATKAWRYPPEWYMSENVVVLLSGTGEGFDEAANSIPLLLHWKVRRELFMGGGGKDNYVKVSCTTQIKYTEINTTLCGILVCLWHQITFNGLKPLMTKVPPKTPRLLRRKGNNRKLEGHLKGYKLREQEKKIGSKTFGGSPFFGHQ